MLPYLCTVAYGNNNASVMRKSKVVSHLFDRQTTMNNYFLYINELCKNFGEPVNLTGAACEDYFKQLTSIDHPVNTFILAARVTSSELLWHHNLDRLVSDDPKFNVYDYFSRIHPKYLQEYMRWGIAIYQYAQEVKFRLSPKQHVFTLMFPMRMLDDKYYWVSLQGIPIQFDKKYNLISHINIYTKLHPYHEDDKMVLRGYIHDNNGGNEHSNFSADYLESITQLKNLVLTLPELELLIVLVEYPCTTTKELAELLQRSKNTLDKQRRSILRKARCSFELEGFCDVNDVAKFISQRGFLPYLTPSKSI